ncbi:MAG: hypothetical protein BGN88_12940 [Clostridiales bacterium 43-6]|nr:MAG: hypothetical protein BGN88_12940 [Clostridiales bacterium 43-6]
MVLKAAIFDMDGTILDSMEMWDKIGYDFLNKKGIELTDSIRKEIEHLKLSEVADYFAEQFDLQMSGKEILEIWLHAVTYEYDNNIKLKPYAREYLEKLKQDGVRMCVATLTEREHAVPALEKHGLLDYFEFVLTVKEVGKSKAHPDIFLQCAQRLGAVPAESTVFEDSIYAAKTAKAAGFKICAIYDTVSQKDKEDFIRLSDCYIHSFEELL